MDDDSDSNHVQMAILCAQVANPGSTTGVLPVDMSLANIRCLALEKVAASLELPCKYWAFGCMGIYPSYCKLKHESQCAYRPYNCPYAGSECSVIGDIPSLVAHLKDDRKVDMHNGSTFNHRYVKSNP